MRPWPLVIIGFVWVSALVMLKFRRGWARRVVVIFRNLRWNALAAKGEDFWTRAAVSAILLYLLVGTFLCAAVGLGLTADLG